MIDHQVEYRDQTWTDVYLPWFDNTMIVVYCKQLCLDWSGLMHRMDGDLHLQVDHHLDIVLPNSCVDYQYSFWIAHLNSLSKVQEKRKASEKGTKNGDPFCMPF